MKRNAWYLLLVFGFLVIGLSGHRARYLELSDQSEALAASTLLTNLVSYYSLDEASGNAIDVHGDNDGTVSGASRNNGGIVGNSYNFGSNQHVKINGVLGDVRNATQGTFSLWVKPSSSSKQVILSFGDANANESIRLFQIDGGRLGVALTDGGSERWRVETSGAVLSSGSWAHISVVQNGKPVLYVNNSVPAQSYKVSKDLDDWFSVCTSLDNARIGTLNAYNSGESLGWRGAIDEVGIWNRALTKDEIASLYNGGKGRGYPFDGEIVSPAPPVGEDGKQVAKPLGGGSGAPKGYLQYLPDDYSKTTRTYPTIIFLHGSGERGNGKTELSRVATQGIPLKIAQGWNAQAGGEKFIVLSPQQAATMGWQGSPKDKIPNDALEFVLWALKDSGLRIDPSRLYLTGLSMGTPWHVAGFEGVIDGKPYKNIFAAIAPVSAEGDYHDGRRVGERGIPVWAFHGGADSAAPLSGAQRPINGMSSVNANPKPILTVYPGLGHGGSVWNTRAYATDNTYHKPNVFEWFLQHRLK
jgi:hypothetical protein